MNPDKLTQAEYRQMKSRLTRCLNRKDEHPEKLLAEADKALARFEDVVPPDDWHRWQRAKEDAVYDLDYEKLRHIDLKVVDGKFMEIDDAPPEEERFHAWTLEKRDADGVVDTCQYQASWAAVTEDHVRTAPSVRNWYKGAELISVVPTARKGLPLPARRHADDMELLPAGLPAPPPGMQWRAMPIDILSNP